MIIVEQEILCNSYAEAKKISGAFDDFSIQWYGLDSNKYIRTARYIKRKQTAISSHSVIIRYKIFHNSDFSTFGFIDCASLKRHPDLPAQLSDKSEEDRLEIIFNVEEEEHLDHGILFYTSFDDFYNRELSKLLQRISLACKVSLGFKFNCDVFRVVYSENGKWFERYYIASRAELDSPYQMLRLDDEIPFDPIKMSVVWKWSKEWYYNKSDKYNHSLRAWSAFSHAVNKDYMDSLLYTFIGLESVYTFKSGFTKVQLKTSIPIVIDYISADEIETLYGLRSDFAHGNITLPMYGERDFAAHVNYLLIQKLSRAFLDTIRLLVVHDGTKIKVKEGSIQFIKEKLLWEHLREFDQEG